MNKFSKLAMLCCIAATMFLASCGSDSTTPSTDKNYYPLTVGNTWTYDGVETEDKAGTTTDIDTSKYTTTTRVDASLTYEGKSAYRLIDSSSNRNGARDTTYISKSGSQLYTYVELIPKEVLNSFGINLDLSSRWVLTSDLNQSTWVILPDTTIKGIQFEYDNLPLSIDITLKINGAKKETSTMTVDNKSVQVQKYTTTVNVTLSISGFAVPFSIISDTYVSENIGIVKTEAHPFTITFPQFLPIPPMSNTGSRETLKTYTVIN